MDRTPSSMAVIFMSPPATHGPVGSTTAGLLCTQTTTACAVIIWSPLDPYDAVEGTNDGLGLTPVIFCYPPAPHEAVGSSTAILLCTTYTHHKGSHPLDYPGPTRCHGRH
ncbi:Tryptophan 5-Hydroxylase 2 [Manis pentadactyla]|nr:Tryptophan 5-Hydroxylase 2 [Manis pentadactyla]